MNDHDKLVKYIRRGIRKGYAIQYLRDKLIDAKHDQKAVIRAISHATGGHQREAARQRLKVLFGALSIIAVVLLAILILSYSNQQKQIRVLTNQVDLTSEAAQTYLAELDRLSAKIDSQDNSVSAKLSKLKESQSNEEVYRLIEELENLHFSIKQERRETRDLLYELLLQIVHRGPYQPDPLLSMYNKPIKKWEVKK